MSDIGSELIQVCENPPAELVEYFDTFPIEDYADELIGLLPLADAVGTSLDFRRFHPLAKHLHLVFLDDANTSNHHCYVTAGPLAGCILYLSHDGFSVAVYQSLAEYLDAVKIARSSDTFMEDLHDQQPVNCPDQEALARAAGTLLGDEDSNEAVEVLIVLISAMDLQNLPLLEKLVRHPNMYVPEAVAFAMARSPHSALLPIATFISKHAHTQVSDAANRVIAAIQGTR